MLTRRAARPLCSNCRLDLYDLFIGGISKPAPVAHVRKPRLQFPKNQSRAFRAAPARFNAGPGAASTGGQSSDIPPSTLEIEATARKARDLFGNTLPADFLSKEEYLVYERLYGPPLRESTEEDLLQAQNELEGDIKAGQEGEPGMMVFRKNRAGRFEAVEEDFEEEQEDEEFEEVDEYEDDAEADKISPEDEASLKAREMLRLDMIEAERRHYVETGEIDEDDTTDRFGPRTHPYTEAGRYGTDPYSITMPRETFVEPITEMLKVASRKHLIEMSHRTFGGPRLQDSIATPVKPKAEHFQQKPIALEATQAKMGEMEANAYVAVNMPGAYASTMSVLVECRKRLGSKWLEDLLQKEGGPRILDAGAAGAGVLAWKDILRAEWARLHPDVKPGDPVPFGKATVVTGSNELRSRVRLLLDNTTFIPRMPDFVPTRDLPGTVNHDPSLRKQYDVIIAAHSLWTLKEDYMRKAQVQNYFTLLNPNGGVLIILEKGVPRGFELVAGAREVLLNHHIGTTGDAENINETTGIRTHKEPGMIVAPCTNHSQCPMYPEAGQMVYRKDWCYFSQRFVRPAFLQGIIGPKHRNHEDIQFSYIAVRRGIDSRPQDQNHRDETATRAALKGYEKSIVEPNPLSLPRLLLPPLKRHKHVVMDVCTPAGKIERWTTSQSFSRQSYRDARKARWGDLWALGAKVRVIREARTGHLKDPNKRKTPSKLAGNDFNKVDSNVSPDATRDRMRPVQRKKSRKRLDLLEAE